MAMRISERLANKCIILTSSRICITGGGAVSTLAKVTLKLLRLHSSSHTLYVKLLLFTSVSMALLVSSSLLTSDFDLIKNWKIMNNRSWGSARSAVTRPCFLVALDDLPMTMFIAAMSSFASLCDILLGIFCFVCHTKL